MEQNKITIEFFHDVLCAWCYALSPRVEMLAEKYHDRIEVVHRSFALAPEPEGIARIFGSKEEGKTRILGHWRAANINADDNRINAELMAQRPFDYPYSTPGLLACKAAEVQGGNAMHHKIFNRIQKAHMTECYDINDFEVLKMCGGDVGLDVEQWEKDYLSEKVSQALDDDLYLASQYGINSVPTLIVNGKYKLSGAQSYAALEEWISQIR
jgi:predicted DsbA family dithiol-disulfide isomerase